MKILQANKGYWPHLGGIETVVRQLAEGFVAEGCDSRVLVASDAGPPSSEHRNGVAVRRVRSFGRVRSLPIAPGYGRALRSEAADVLLIHEPSLLAATALLVDRGAVRRRFGRLVVWWHSDIVRQRFLGRVLRPVQRHLLEAADRIIVATPHHVAASPALAGHTERIEVIPFGLDLARFTFDEARRQRVRALRDRWGDAPLVLSVGRLARYKGLHLLAEAMDAVDDAHFVVVGDGPCRSQLTDSRAHRRGRVTLLPPQTDEALVDLYYAADVFVLPSHQPSEAFGIVQLEAMACGTPVVTLDLPTGVTWVNRHGETGLVARRSEPGSLARAITTLLADPRLRHSLGLNARCRVRQEFSERTMVRSTLDVCRGA